MLFPATTFSLDGLGHLCEFVAPDVKLDPKRVELLLEGASETPKLVVRLKTDPIDRGCGHRTVDVGHDGKQCLDLTSRAVLHKSDRQTLDLRKTDVRLTPEPVRSLDTLAVAMEPVKQ